MILAVEEDFEPYAVNFLPYLLECMAMNDWATRKMAIDVIYTLAAILKEVLIPFKGEILEVLNHSRFDKYKPVREATIEAYQTIKNLGGEEYEEEEEQEPASKPTNKKSSLRETIRQAKKDKAKVQQEPDFEILDKSDNDRKLSAATQKRLESKRVAMKTATDEDKKDTGPISYDNVKSHLFKGPKNRNFFKKQKKEKQDEIEIFTAGDKSKFDYEEDMRKHQEREEQFKRTKAKDEDFGVEIYEGKKANRENSKDQDTGKYREQFHKEDRKGRNDHEERQINHGGTKDPEEIPVQIYVKGNPHQHKKEEQFRDREERQQKQTRVEIHSPKGFAETAQREGDRDETLDDVEIQGEEYEHSMNLLKQHQEMMNKKKRQEPTNRNTQFEFVQKQDSRESGEHRNPNFTTYAPPGQYRVNNYQPHINAYQNYSQPSNNDFMLQKRIEQFTQQMTTSMSNLQNYVRNEMAGVKQRISYLESKVESLARRQNELELDKLNQNSLKSNLDRENLMPAPAPITLESFSAPPFEKEMYQPSHLYSHDDKNKSYDGVDEWSHILGLVQEEKLNSAYTLVLKKNDDMLLFKLMGRTGVCLEKLDPENLVKLLRCVAITLSSKSFIDLLLPWVNQYYRQFSQLHPAVQSTAIVKSIKDALFTLLNDTQNYLDKAQKEDVERVYLGL